MKKRQTLIVGHIEGIAELLSDHSVRTVFLGTCDTEVVRLRVRDFEQIIDHMLANNLVSHLSVVSTVIG